VRLASFIRVCTLFTLVGCSEQTLRGVVGKSCLDQPEQAACARDPWLAAHGDTLRSVRPRLLVLNFHNQKSAADLREIAERQMAALAEGSRYHAYLNDSAPTFLQYQLLDVLDFRDATPPSDWAFSSSSQVPLDGDGQFDVAALFGEPFAQRIARVDPDTGRVLDLCEQFEQGVVNELWIAVGDTKPGREPPPMIECKLKYDAAGAALPDEPRVGPAECAALPTCNATVRIAHLSPLRGVGCDLLVRGWAIRDSVRALPYLRENAARFFNLDLDSRYGAPIDSLLDHCEPGDSAPCVRFATPSTLESATEPPFRIEGFGEGCGMPEFPPNATFMWDFANKAPAASRCEHYGLQDGDDGEDAVTLYDASRIASLEADYPECGGAWQIYWRQSMPGLDNRGRATDGTAMKNWWPFLFF
jgi:hypothetical protein